MGLDEINVIILGSVAVIVAGLITAIVNMLRAKKQELVERAKHTKFETIVAIVTDTIDDVLLSIEDTTIAQIKYAVADGKITSEEITEIVDIVKEKVGLILTDKIQLNFLVDVVDDWDEWLETKIHACVVRYTKKNHNSVTL